MGRMSDRFGQRRHPHFHHAKELVEGAVAAASSGDEAPLAAQLDAKLDTLSPELFEQVIGVAYKELQQRRGAEAAIQCLVATARDVSQTMAREDGAVVTLFGLVLQVPGGLREELSQAEVDAAVQALQRHGLLAEGEVTMLRRLLLPSQSNALRAGEVYALCRALGGADHAAAHLVLERSLAASFSDLESAGMSTGDVVATLVGTVACRQGTAFPLPASLEAQLPHAEASALQPVGYAFTPPHLLEELRRKLAGVATELASALGGRPVQLVQPAGLFSQANMHAVNLQRAQQARELLDGLASQHANGRLAGLTVARAEPDAHGLSATVHRRLDHEVVGRVRWPVARYEPLQDGLLQFLTLLDELGLLDVPDDAGAGDQLH